MFFYPWNHAGAFGLRNWNLPVLSQQTVNMAIRQANVVWFRGFENMFVWIYVWIQTAFEKFDFFLLKNERVHFKSSLPMEQGEDWNGSSMVRSDLATAKVSIYTFPCLGAECLAKQWWGDRQCTTHGTVDPFVDKNYPITKLGFINVDLTLHV